jgi:hypothetical protein
MPKHVIKDLGETMFSIAFSPGFTAKQLLDIFREKLTEPHNGQPRWGWELWDSDYDAEGSFVVRAINDDNLTYKYAVIFIEFNKLVMHLAENWDTETHTSTKWCGYRNKNYGLANGYVESSTINGSYELTYYPVVPWTDRSILICGASARWLMVDVKPYSRATSYAYPSDDSATGIFEVKSKLNDKNAMKKILQTNFCHLCTSQMVNVSQTMMQYSSSISDQIELDRCLRLSWSQLIQVSPHLTLLDLQLLVLSHCPIFSLWQ